jgi:site-specific recombinase XerD
MSCKKISGLLHTYHKELSQLRNFSTDTVNIYVSCVHTYLEYATNEWAIDPLQTTSEHLLQFFLDLKAFLSPSRLSHYRAALKGFFALLFNLAVIAKNPADDIVPIKRVKSQRYRVVPEQLMFTLLETVDAEATATAKRDHLMIALLWCLGLRSGELRALRKKHITIISVKEKTALLMVNGKGAKQRALMVVEKLYQKVIEYISPLKSNDLLFPGKIKDKMLHDTTLNRRMARYVAKAGITERIHAHRLRHSFATEMYNAGVPLEDLRVMLGHENYRETAVYIHISQTQTMQALELLSIEGGTYGF